MLTNLLNKPSRQVCLISFLFFFDIVELKSEEIGVGTTESEANQTQIRAICQTISNLCVSSSLKAATLSVSGNQSVSGTLTANKIKTKNIEADSLSAAIVSPMSIESINANDINGNLVSGNLVVADNIVTKAISADNAQFDNLSLKKAQINQLTVEVIAGVFASNYKVSTYVGTDRIIDAETELIPFDTEVFDFNNNFDTENFSYTAPISGTYLVTVQLSVQTYSTNLRSIQLLKNGVLQTGYSSAATMATEIRNVLNLSSLIHLSAGDTLSVQYSGQIQDIIKSADTSLNIHLLSI